MKFPNAANGVKKLFTAQVLSLIAAIATIIGLALLIITAASAEANVEGGAIAAGLGTIVLMGAASVLILIAAIMSLVGLIQSAKDEGAFKTALILIISSLIAAVVGGIFYQNATVQSICQIVQNLMSIFVTVFVIKGITNIAAKIGNDEVAQQGKSLLTIIVVFYALSLIANILVLVFGGMFASVLGGVLAVVALVLNIIAYIVYLSLLSKGKNMLAE